jgi:cytidylate kinase
MTREISPLVKADDAIEFDTTGHTAESSANELIEVLGLCPKSC